MKPALVIIKFSFLCDCYSSFFLVPGLDGWGSGNGGLLGAFVILLYLSVLQNQPKLHGPEQAGFSSKLKDSQREKWLEMRFLYLYLGISFRYMEIGWMILGKVLSNL